MRFRALRALGIGLLAATLVGGTVSAGTPGSAETTLSPQDVTPTPPDATPTPAKAIRKVTLGVSMLPDGDTATFDAFTTATGRAPAIWSIWSDWGNASGPFPSTVLLNHLKQAGSVPMIIWQPVDYRAPNSDAYSYRHIIAGDHDAYLTQWAQAAKAWGGRVLIRFAQEMDGNWFPWSVTRFDNTPKRFVTAWRHIWNIFRGPSGVGANNVRFLWSPIAPSKSKQNLYPGNAYVDYVGFTSFNWGAGRGWKSMKDLYKRSVGELAKFTTKPVIVAETGSGPDGGNKAAWIRDGYPAVYKAYPKITAIIYFNVDTRNVGQRDWRLVSPIGAQTAYKRILAKPQFQGKLK